MRKLTLATLGIMVFCSLAITALVLWGRIPPRDTAGETPQSVARSFVDSVRAGDFVRASGYWRQGDISNIQSNSDMEFAEFCKAFFKCDSYKLTSVGRQKEQSFLVEFTGTYSGGEKAYSFYLKRVDGKWKLVTDRFM